MDLVEQAGQLKPKLVDFALSPRFDREFSGAPGEPAHEVTLTRRGHARAGRRARFRRWPTSARPSEPELSTQGSLPLVRPRLR